MIEELIYKFTKANEERKMFIFYLELSIPISLTVLLLKCIYNFNFLIYIGLLFLFLFFVLIILYVYMCARINLKIFSKSIFYVKNNIGKYGVYEKDKNTSFIYKYLDEHNLLSKDNILFIINDIRLRKPQKMKRDWLSLASTIILSILIASIKGVEIDIDILLTILLWFGTIAVIIILLWGIYKTFFKWIYDNTSIKSSIVPIELILTDIYLKMD